MTVRLTQRLAGAAIAGGVALAGVAALPTVAFGADAHHASAQARPPAGCRNPGAYAKPCKHTTRQSSDTVRQGGLLVLVFTQLRPGSTITVDLAGVGTASTRANSNGVAVVNFRIPRAAKIGPHTITIKGTNGDGTPFTETRRVRVIGRTTGGGGGAGSATGGSVAGGSSSAGSGGGAMGAGSVGSAGAGSVGSAGAGSVGSAGAGSVGSAGASSPTRGLAFTGAETGALSLTGLALVSGGTVAVVISRRRRRVVTPA